MRETGAVEEVLAALHTVTRKLALEPASPVESRGLTPVLRSINLSRTSSPIDRGRRRLGHRDPHWL